jgi:hypothetical protein
MKILISIFFILHGAIHYLGFAKSRNPDAIPALKEAIQPSMGYVWALAAIIIVSAGVLVLLQNHYWWVVGFAGILLSQVLIITAWSDSSKGTILNVILLIPVIIAFLAQQKTSKAERAFGEIQNREVITAELPGTYPYAFLKYIAFSQVSSDDYQSNLYRILQSGRMRPNPDGNWMNFTAEQHFQTATHEFVWFAQVELPLNTKMYGLDRYVSQKGRMDISVLGAFPVVAESGAHIDQGSLIRYIAELNWVPSGFFHPDIQITGEDRNSFTVRIPSHDPNAAVTFHINDLGMLHKITAMRPINAESEHPWRIELDTSSYTELNHAFIAEKASLYWDMPDGENHWLDIEVESITPISSTK